MKKFSISLLFPFFALATGLHAGYISVGDLYQNLATNERNIRRGIDELYPEKVEKSHNAYKQIAGQEAQLLGFAAENQSDVQEILSEQVRNERRVTLYNHHLNKMKEFHRQIVQNKQQFLTKEQIEQRAKSRRNWQAFWGTVSTSVAGAGTWVAYEKMKNADYDISLGFVGAATLCAGSLGVASCVNSYNQHQEFNNAEKTVKECDDKMTTIETILKESPDLIYSKEEVKKAQEWLNEQEKMKKAKEDLEEKFKNAKIDKMKEKTEWYKKGPHIAKGL